MDTWSEIRRIARTSHEAALVVSKGDRSARAITAAALTNNDDLEIRRYEPGSIVNKGVVGFLDRSSRLVNVAAHQSPQDEVVVIAHEVGHYQLHSDPTNEVTVREPALGGDPIDSGAGRVEGYSPRERKEIQADVFAGEFLCPSDWLRQEFVVQGKRPSNIAAELGVPLNLVINQFIRALLLPPLSAPTTKPTGATYTLDASQQIAATWSKGPLLVDAGPGTGKTRTLVERIKYLLDNGARPGSILALTFSNKAAEEMRERLSAMNPNAAIEMWVGTFHAFGLELLRKWPSTVSRTGNVRVLDQTGSLAVLEDNLARLPLNHYQNLYEPAFELVNVLRAISRCKDELISPADYLAESKLAMDAAINEDQKEAAEKAIEVAEIYQIYETVLKDSDAVDFGDLVLLATKLVNENADVKTYVSGFKHILVDEYQDVNLASARLLQAICSEATDLWVVADQRQSIYRFRGAEPSNVDRFTAEFKGTRHSLAVNYRSFAPVVQTFQAFSGSMGGGAMVGNWTANRGSGPGVTLNVTPTVGAEAEAIRDKIEEFRGKGIPYADQAILARTHLTLARITGILEQLGVPLLYLGDLFERDEIRTLLSLVAIDAEFGGIGLIRVAALPAYQTNRGDALTVIRWAQTQNVQIIEALNRISEIEGVSETSRIGLKKLGEELRGLSEASPWTLLTTWLFERSDYLRPIVIASDPGAKQKLVAIYHLLKVCGEQSSTGCAGRRRFLDRIRRIEALNQDSTYRAVASEAGDIDAVRVMTIHGSKGLEFRAVHFPALATRYTPTSRKPNHCPPPPSLAHLAMLPAHHDAEEECLFFVGLSRARDYLSLSRAEQYTTQNASPSKFLPPIHRAVQTRNYRGSRKSDAFPSHLIPTARLDRYQEEDLAIYLKCPARFRYEVIERLRGPRAETAYVRFHGCVYATIAWLESEREQGHTIDITSSLAHLAGQWKASGPTNHAFEAFYRVAAENMVKAIAKAMVTEIGQYSRQEWAVPVASKHVLITPDRVLLMPQAVVRVQRIRTGRETKSESGKAIYALLRRGAALRYPGKKVHVETFYLATGEVVRVAQGDDAKLLEQYADAIDGIENGNFEPAPNARTCPNCECYFMCRG